MRIWLKRIGVGLLIPVGLFLLASVLLYVPAVQNMVVKKAMTVISESIGLNVRIERVRLAFPLDLSVRDAVMIGGEKDTLAHLGKLTVDVRLKPLLKGQITVKGLHIESLNLNTGDLIDGMVINGTVGKAYLQADSVNLKEEQAWVNHIRLSDAEVDLLIGESTEVNSAVTDSANLVATADSVVSPSNWRIRLKKVELKNVAFACQIPSDSVYVNLLADKAVLSDGLVDLGAELYGASELRAQLNELYYGTDMEDVVSKGLDFSHIRLHEVALVSDSIYYYTAGNTVHALIREFSANERSGLEVKSFSGRFEMDDMQFGISDLSLKTPFSTVQMQAVVPWSSIDGEKSEGQLSLNLTAFVHKQDVLRMTGTLSDTLQSIFPDTVLTVEAVVHGNQNNILLQKFDCTLPDAFQCQIAGAVASPTDNKLRNGRIDFSVEMQKMDFVTELFPDLLPQRFQIPDSMQLFGFMTFEKDLYASEALLEESLGKIRFLGNYNASSESYEARLTIDSLQPHHFMPDDSIRWLSASVYAKGQGTDIYHAATQAEMEGRVNELHYGSFTLTEQVAFSAKLTENHLQASVTSNYPLAKGRISVDGDMRKEQMKGMVIVDIDSLDFYRLNLTESPLSSSFQLFSEFDTDLEKTHALDVTLGNWRLVFDNQTVEPKMMTLAIRSDIDTTRASFYAGDLHVMLTGNADLESLTEQFTQLAKKAEEQFLRDTVFYMEELRPYFPDMTLHVIAERDNPIYNFLQEYNTFFETLHFDATISPNDGLAIDGTVLAIVKDTFKIDTFRLDLWQDTSGLQYAAAVVKNRFRNQEPFNIDINGYIRENEVDMLASYRNGRGEKGLYLGVNAKKASDRFDFHFYPRQSVIAFLPFTINENNYFRFKNKNEMEADLRLDGRANSSIWIHSAQQQDESMKEMMIEVNKINLRDVSSGFAGLPSLRGLLDITFRYEPEENSFMIIADGNIDDFYYEEGRVGELLFNATYMPFGEGEHQVDIHAFHDMSEIVALSALYQEGVNESKIKGFLSVDRFPLNIVNAMIPDQMAQLNGFLNGKVDITGTDNNPIVDGTMRFDKGSVYVAPLSTTLHFDDRTIQVAKNKIRLNQFRLYAHQEQPLLIDGSIDVTDMEQPTADLRMTAANMPLVDTRKMPGSLVHGRLFVNVNSTLSGPLEALRMRGNVRVLGNTNLTYVMSDSPLDVEDNFGSLVTFTYFADTLPGGRGGRPFYLMSGARSAAAAAGTDILMNINIDPIVRLRVDLDDEQSNFVELRGGGDLSLHYTSQGDISLNGRYTLSDGTIRYAIPIIPLTDFTVRNGSYVDWSGDPMNPYLNITAYTRARSSVNFDNQSEMVDFNAGIQLRDNLEDVTVQFLLEAPNNAVIQNQLTAMGAEERSKQAISLLMTGVYLESNSAGNDKINVSAALNSLLQREIKNILGNMLGDVPFTFDVNTYDGTQGKGRRVDYIGRFHKDFFHERFNATVGLLYSTKDPLNSDKLFLDDVTLEYRLDTDGSRAVQVFHNKEYENTFEGEIAKTGVGFTIRRKVKQLKDLFIFKKGEAVPVRKEEEGEE